MSSASDTTARRRQRTLYADRIIQQETFDKGYKNHIVLEGGNAGVGAMTYPPYTNMIAGAVLTTPQELATYRASVPAKVTVPGSPTNASATAGNSEATVVFMPPSNTGGSPITSYTVISSPGGITATGPSSPITITGLANGTAYTFTVIATNSVGDSVASGLSNEVTPATYPDAPIITSVTRGGSGEVVVAFTPGFDGGSAITQYTITSSPGGITASGSSSPITVSGLTDGTSYTFTIIATNAVGDSDASSVSNSIISATVPSAPSDLVATPANEQIELTFTQSSNGGSPITNYAYSLDGGAFTPFSPATGAVTTVTITGLTNDTPYTIRLKAMNDVGSSTESEPVTETPISPTLLLFTTVGSGTWTCPSGVTSIDYVVVGGGGGGGGAAGTGSGGGGGGGSVKQGILSVTPGTVYSYTVGGGGTGGLNTSTNGTDGQNTVFAIITAEGGGKGYSRSGTNLTGQICRGGAAQDGDTPADGGSGGGTRNNDSSGGLTANTGAGAGGGGGAGGPGSDGFDATPGDATSAVGGNGGAGITNSLSGTSVEYGKGGKGGNEALSNLNGANGAANTGNGGQGAQATSWGGVGAAGGNGGSGIIIINWTT